MQETIQYRKDWILLLIGISGLFKLLISPQLIKPSSLIPSQSFLRFNPIRAIFDRDNYKNSLEYFNMSRNGSFVNKIPHLENNTFLQFQPKPVSIHTPVFKYSIDYSTGKFNIVKESNRNLNSSKERPASTYNRHTTEKVHMLNVSLHDLTGMLKNKRKRISSALGRLRENEELSTSKQYLDTSFNSTLSQTHKSRNYLNSTQDYILELQDFSFTDENFDPNKVCRISQKVSFSSTTSDKAIQAILQPSKSILKKPVCNSKTQTIPSRQSSAATKTRACPLSSTSKSKYNKSFT